MRNFEISLVHDGRHRGHLDPLLAGRDLQVPGLGRQLPQPGAPGLPVLPRPAAVPPLPGRQQQVVVAGGVHQLEVGAGVRAGEDPLEGARLAELLLGVDQHPDVTRRQLPCKYIQNIF